MPKILMLFFVFWFCYLAAQTFNNSYKLGFQITRNDSTETKKNELILPPTKLYPISLHLNYFYSTIKTYPINKDVRLLTLINFYNDVELYKYRTIQDDILLQELFYGPFIPPFAPEIHK